MLHSPASEESQSPPGEIRGGFSRSGLSENDFRWFAARLSIAVQDTRKLGGMSVLEMRQALKHIPGAEDLTLTYAPNGNELVTIAGRTVEVSATASNAEIAEAFATPAPAGTITVIPTAAPIAVTPIPPVTMTTAPKTGTASMSITGAAPVTLSIKQMIEASRQTVKAAHEKLTTNAGKVAQAAAALDSLGDDLGKEGDDLLAMIGQYKNDIGGTAS